MSKFLSIFFILGLIQSVFGQELIIENLYNVKVDRYHQFKATLHYDDGTTEDVTRKAIWSSMNGMQRKPGEFYFNIPFNLNPNGMHAVLNVQLAHNGQIFQEVENILVDTSPDFIDIIGPRSSMSRGSLFLRAYGRYPTRRVDLTQQGFWRANFGMFNGPGFYSAPAIRRGGAVYDHVTFQFGWQQGTHSVFIRN